MNKSFSNSLLISSCNESGNFLPSLEKNLIPLSNTDYDAAEITIPAWACNARVRCAIAGVGNGPSK